MHQGSFSLPGSSTEIGQSHALKDVLLHHTLLLIPFGRLEQSPPKLSLSVLGLGRSSRPGSPSSPPEQKRLQAAVPSCRGQAKGRGCQDSGAGPEQLELPQRSREVCRAQAQLSITMGQHPVSLPWGARKGKDEAQN